MASAPSPGLARCWARARHKRPGASVPATPPQPPAAQRGAAGGGRRGLGAGPRAGPRAAGARCEAGAAPDASDPPGGAFRAAPQRTRRGGDVERKGETYLAAEGPAGLRLPTPDAAGVWHGGRRRKALARLRAGLHLASTGNSPRRRPRAALPPRRETQARSSRPPRSGGRRCPPLAGRLLPRGPHPVTSAARAPSSLTLPPVTPPSASSHPPQPTCFCRSLRSELPLPEPPPLLGNPTVSERRGGPRKHGGWLTRGPHPHVPGPSGPQNPAF